MPDPLNPTNLLTPKPPPTPYGTTSVADRVTDLAGQDSAINQMARTEAAKVMNSRGMLNSSMTAGASMDAVLRAATPIASQDASQAFQGSQSELDRTSREGMQMKDIAFQTGENALSRASQEKLAGWSLKSSDRNAAAQFLINVEHEYSNDYNTIMANTNLNATQRTQQLAAAKKLLDRRRNFDEQLWNIDLRWALVPFAFMLPDVFSMFSGTGII